MAELDVKVRRRGLSTTALMGGLVAVATVAGVLSFYLGQGSGSSGNVTVTGAATTASITVVSTARSNTTSTTISTSTVNQGPTTTQVITLTSMISTLCPGCVVDYDGDGN